MTAPRPAIVAHADWSRDAAKQRLAVARLLDGRYVAEAPGPVGDPRALLATLRREANGGGVLAGFDFPIGVPRAWAAAAGVTSFRALLPELGSGRWSRFFDVARLPEEIGLPRPFYPAGVHGVKQTHLCTALGVGTIDDLRRRCDRPTATRGAACAIFWTLGANQVGKAAIAGWREVLQPAWHEIAVWPFDGELATLLAEHELVVTETYPAEASAQIGLTGAKSKADQRAANADRIAGYAARLGVKLEPGLEVDLKRGFNSDDDFDAVLGLLGMLAVVLGVQPSGEPRDDTGLPVEGWILGQVETAAPPRQCRRRAPRERLAFATAAERPDLWERAQDLDADVWPTYNHHGNVLNRFWPRLDEEFAAFQFVLYDEARHALLAHGHSVPFRWDGAVAGLPAGIDGLIEAAFALRTEGAAPNALGALGVEIPPAHQGRRLSGTMLAALREIAARHGLGDLVAPVRPSWKERYPLTSIEHYASWTDDDGLPFDPWMRVHARMGAEILAPEARSLRIAADVASWERWTEMRFPESGEYVFPHGLALLGIDIEADSGEYFEPNVWMRHRLG